MKKSLVLFLWLALALGLPAQYNLSTPEFLVSMQPSGAAPFSPADLGSLKGWWVGPDAVSTNASNVVFYWPDKSGQARHLTNNYLGRMPFKTNTLNGLSVVTFGLTNFLYTQFYTNNAEAEWWGVLNFHALPTGSGILVYGGDAGGTTFQRITHNSFNSWYSQGANLTSAPGWWAFTDRWVIYMWKWGNLFFLLKTNNVQCIVGNAGSSGAGPGGLMLNTDRTTAGSGYACKWAELIFYNKTNTVAHATKVYQYLKTKWGTSP